MMAKVHRYKHPRICIDSLPTNGAYLTPTMSESNLTCSSCMCCDQEEEETPCCTSTKCDVNIRRNEQQTQTQMCCKIEPEELDPNCPICRETIEKEKEKALCKKCEAKANNQEQVCPSCKAKEANVCSVCKEQIQKKADNTCPVCKKEDKGTSKKKEKQLHCPSCSQPVAIKCCTQGSAHSVSIMIIPEKLLKDMSTNTRGEDDDNDDTPCCQVQKEQPKKHDKQEQCCKIEEPCCKTPDQKYLDLKNEKGVGCGMDSCISMKKPEKPVLNKPAPPKPVTPSSLTPKPSTTSTTELKKKDSKTKKGKKAADSDATAAEVDDDCCCVFPPAYKQYKCAGRISGTCDCTKEEKTA